jgi:hypothetical protein
MQTFITRNTSKLQAMDINFFYVKGKRKEIELEIELLKNELFKFC